MQRTQPLASPSFLSLSPQKAQQPHSKVQLPRTGSGAGFHYCPHQPKGQTLKPIFQGPTIWKLYAPLNHLATGQNAQESLWREQSEKHKHSSQMYMQSFLQQDKETKLQLSVLPRHFAHRSQVSDWHKWFSSPCRVKILHLFLILKCCINGISGVGGKTQELTDIILG